MRRSVPRGLVDSKARQALARALMRSGPVTAPGLAKEMGRSVALSSYHLRVLALVDAVTPSVTGAADTDEVAWVLTAGNLPPQAREVLLGEVSLATWKRLSCIVMLGDPQDLTQLASRLGLSRHEVARYMKVMQVDGVKGMPRSGTGNLPDRIGDLPEWLARARFAGEADSARDDTDDRR